MPEQWTPERAQQWARYIKWLREKVAKWCLEGDGLAELEMMLAADAHMTALEQVAQFAVDLADMPVAQFREQWGDLTCSAALELIFVRARAALGVPHA